MYGVRLLLITITQPRYIYLLEAHVEILHFAFLYVQKSLACNDLFALAEIRKRITSMIFNFCNQHCAGQQIHIVQVYKGFSILNSKFFHCVRYTSRLQLS